MTAADFHTDRRARHARLCTALNLLADADVRGLANGPQTDTETRYAAVTVLASRKVDVVWLTYPDQGDEMGAVECVLAWDKYCESCEKPGTGLTGVDTGIHVCHGCNYGALARGVIRIVEEPS